MADKGTGSTDRLSAERRARLAAERLLDQRTLELHAANEKLARHARALTEQITEQRQVVASARSSAELLRGQNARALSELGRAHGAAVTAERRLWDSVDAIPDGFAVFAADQTLVKANRAYMQMFRQLPRLRPGILYADMIALIAREGLVQIGEEGAEHWIERVLARWDEDPVPPEVVQFRDGSWVRLLDRRARDGDMVTLALDITEQQRVIAAIEALQDGFVLFDRQDRIVLCNKRFRTRYSGAEEVALPGATMGALIAHGLSQNIYVLPAGGEAAWVAQRLAWTRSDEVDTEMQFTDGRTIRLLERRTPDGGRVGLRIDVTEQKRRESELEAARSAAEAANRAKSAFLANMSHEIRTPMNAVIGMAELLCGTPLNDDQRLFAETIRSSGERLLILIDDILDYSRIEAARPALHPEPFDLERLIRDVAILQLPQARARGLDLMIDWDPMLPAWHLGDPEPWRRVLNNLLGNAVKFTPAGHVLIRVTGTPRDNGHEIHVTVEDTGIGIAPEHRDLIFGEFNQVEVNPNRKFEGAGLGLAITRRLIGQMGGTVWVRSELGKGSCFGFRLVLPMVDGDATQAPAPQQIGQVLLIDGHLLSRAITKRQLEGMGIRSITAGSVEDAARELANGALADLIVIDENTADLGNLGMILNGAPGQRPVILLAADPTAERKGLEPAELVSTAQKPVLRAELLALLLAAADPPGAGSSGSGASPETADGARRVMRVLAAEDNRTNQLVFSKMVRDLDIDLRFAGNGIEAVAIWHEFRPDLIFMDISMPDMDGKDAALCIRSREAELGSHVPIIAMTAHAMPGDEAEILAAGIDRYLTKPLRRGTIAAVIAELCPPGVRPVRPGGTADGI